MYPPEADCFSFAALSAANENNILLCALCVLSEAGGEINIVWIIPLCRKD
jgi:hypothetical protein